MVHRKDVNAVSSVVRRSPIHLGELGITFRRCHQDLLLSQRDKLAIAKIPWNFETSRRSEGSAQTTVH